MKSIGERARNLKLFYWSMLGFPGINLAKELINRFCHYRKFTFGRYKGKCIGEIMMMDFPYIKWCLDNIPSFEMNEEEKALYNTGWKHNVGGYTDEIDIGGTGIGDTYTKDGDTYDRYIISREIELLETGE